MDPADMEDVEEVEEEETGEDENSKGKRLKMQNCCQFCSGECINYMIKILKFLIVWVYKNVFPLAELV